MPTRNIVLTEAQTTFLSTLVRSGRYQNVSEALRDGVRLLQDANARREAEVAAIRAGVLEGVSQANGGQFAPGSGKDAIDRAFCRANKTAAE